jgi:hypothetical protein
MAAWTVLPTTSRVQLPTREQDTNNIQNSEPRAKRKADDDPSAAPFSALRSSQPKQFQRDV